MELEDNHETLINSIKDSNAMIKDLGKLVENSLMHQIQQKKTLIAENDVAKVSMATIMKEDWTLF